MNENKRTLVSEILKKPSLENLTISDTIITIAENLKNSLSTQNKAHDCDDDEDDFDLDSEEGKSTVLESSTLLLYEQKVLLSRAAAYLGTNEVQTLIFCVLYSLQTYNEIDFAKIANNLGIPAVTLLRYKPDIQKMVDRRLIVCETSSGGYRRRNSENYSISKEALNCIVQGKKLKLKKRKDENDIYSFFSKVDDIIQNNGARFANHTVDEMNELEEEYKAKPYIKNLKKIVTKNNDRFILYTLCAARIQDCFVNLGLVIRRFYFGSEKGTAKNQFMAGTHFLQKQELVELEIADFVDKTEISISNKGLRVLLGEDAMCFTEEKTAKALLPEKISQKDLFYSPEMETQLSTIYDALDEENFKALQERMEKKGMHKGVAVLFYGAPGTGKTESVFQIAKKTDRPVVQVDISETKTKWFGESERLTKKIFVNYKEACKEAKRNGRKVPILFINEADAIISKRRALGDDNCRQTENALQNIFLEEIENLEGILIATTNLADNMDNAFDRRFLFKVKFEKPEVSARAKIWQSKLNFLSDEEATKLASNYEFSGGQIDNIARKIEIDEVITGVKPEMGSIIQMCDHETLHEEDSVRRVGFCA